MSDKRFVAPTSIPGKISLWLNVIFIIVVAVSLILVLVLRLLSFDDRWWDVTVAVLAFSTLIAFISGLVATIKNKDRSLLPILSVAVSVLAILFALLHSLFISD